MPRCRSGRRSMLTAHREDAARNVSGAEVRDGAERPMAWPKLSPTVARLGPRVSEPSPSNGCVPRTRPKSTALAHVSVVTSKKLMNTKSNSVPKLSRRHQPRDFKVAPQTEGLRGMNCAPERSVPPHEAKTHISHRAQTFV